MRKAIAVLPVIAVAAVLSGCISLTQHIALHEDGSARVTIDTWVDDMTGLLSETAPPAEGETGATDEPKGAVEPIPPIENEMGPAFAGLEGITVVENWAAFEGEKDARKIHTRLVLDVDKIDRLNGVGIYKDSTFELKTKGKEVDFSQVIINKERKEPTTAENQDLMRQMFANYTFTYKLEMPYKVKSTNGQLNEDGKTITWSWSLVDYSNMEKVEMKATAKK